MVLTGVAMIKSSHKRIVLALTLSFAFVQSPSYGYAAPELSRYINDGINFHSNRNYPKAIESFQKAVELDPHNQDILENISIAHNNYGKYLAERTDSLGAAREFRNSLYYNPQNEIARKNLEVKLEALGKLVNDHLERVAEAAIERKKGNFFAAIAEAREANRIERSVDAYLEIGEAYQVLYLKSGPSSDYAKDAIAALQNASTVDVNDPRPLIKLGDVYIAQHAISKGIDKYKEAIAVSPDSELAQNSLIKGWLAAIRIAPQEPSNHVGLATAYQIKGKFDQAERGFRRALELDPNNKLAKEGIDSIRVDRVKTQVKLFLSKAFKLQKDRQYDASLAEYIKALNLEPENPDIHYNIGTVFQAKQDIERAQKAYNKALEFRPDHIEAKQALTNIDIQEQEKAVQRGFAYALEQQKKGNYAEAINVYQSIAKDRPKDDTLYFNMGTIYQEMKEFDKAVESYKKAFAIKPEETYTQAIEAATVDKANDFLALGIKQQTEGLNGEAIKSYKKVVEIVPENANAWYNLGTAYQAESQAKNALEAYQKAYTLDADNQTDAIFFAAILQEENRKLPEAIELYEKYLTVAPAGSYAKDSKDRSEYIKSFL